jgi:hypothetical protein
MSHHYEILGLFFFMPFFSVCQKKQDNTIVVQGITMNIAMQKVLDLGFIIADTDNSTFINICPRNTRNNRFGIVVKYRICVEDTTVTITGDLCPRYMLDEVAANPHVRFYPIYFGGGFSSPLKMSWKAMNEFAKTFGLPVSYTRL